MRNLFLGLSFVLVSIVASAQTPATPAASPEKSITVTGTAEMEVVPDELYFSIVLKEYMKDKTKIELEKLEKELQQAVNAAGIPKENFMVQQVYGQKWRRKKSKDAELLNSKTYTIKVSEPGKIDEVLDKVNAESIEQVYLSNYSHSKMPEYKKQLKIEAIKAAKHKAGYLLEAIDEKLGEALEVTEADYGVYPMQPRAVYAQSNVAYDSYESGGESDIGFQKIKLQFQVTVKFRIK